MLARREVLSATLGLSAASRRIRHAIPVGSVPTTPTLKISDDDADGAWPAGPRPAPLPPVDLLTDIAHRVSADVSSSPHPPGGEIQPRPGRPYHPLARHPIIPRG